MEVICIWCGEPALPGRPDPTSVLPDGSPVVRVYCARCWERDAEEGRRYDEVQALGGIYIPSKDDPFYRDWLMSRELFVTYHDIAPHLCKRVDRMLGGDVLQYGNPGSSPGNLLVQVWASANEVVVAYGYGVETKRIRFFENLLHHLRYSEPLELGKTYGASSYGASCLSDPEAMPCVKWAQWGDWCALAHNWYWAAKKASSQDRK
jgi:hypothetical protein